MALGQRNDAVQAFPPQCANEPLAQGVRLGTAHRGFEHSQTQMAYTLVERSGKDAVPIVDQEAIRVVRRYRFAQLLKRPMRRGICSCIDMQDPAGRVFHHDKHVKQAKDGCDHDTEITCNDRPGMVAHKRDPTLRQHPFAWSRGLALREVFAYRAR